MSDSSSMTHIGIRFLVTLAELDFWRQSCFERLATTSPGSLLDVIFIARLLLILILFRHESYSLFGADSQLFAKKAQDECDDEEKILRVLRFINSDYPSEKVAASGH